MTEAVLALGANLGDARAALRAAVAGLASQPGVRVRAVSGLWRTEPVGGPEQPDFLNAVVLVTTTLEPEELLAVAHDLEDAAGRRRAVRWGPRTLDVDLGDVGGARRSGPALVLPHPRAHERAFVLAPWAQAAPAAQLVLPDGRAARVRDLLAELPDQGVALLEEGPWWR
jgi:2-amino-4-hydroxy-6-hydroxymethyldihydropteridine diphosphokinase